MKNKYLLNANDVMEILNCKRTTAYKTIKTINNKLKKEGLSVIPGKVSKSHLFKEYGLCEKKGDQSSWEI